MKLNDLEKELQSLDKALAHIISLTPDPDDKIYQGKNGKKLYKQDLKAAELKFIQSSGGKLKDNKWIQSAFNTKTTWRGATRTAPISTALADLFIGSDREGIGADGFSTVGGHSQGKPGLVQARKMLAQKQNQVINLLSKSEWTRKDVIPIEIRQSLGITRGSSLLGTRSNPNYNREFSSEYINARQEMAGNKRGLFAGRKKNTDEFANYDSSTYADKYRFGIRTDHFQSSNKEVNNENRSNVSKNFPNSSSSSLSIGSGNTVYGGGGWFGSGTDIRTSTGGSTALTIHKGDDYYVGGKHLKAGDTLGVLTRKQRARYDTDNPHYMN